MGEIWVRVLLEMVDILGNLLQPPLAHRASELGGALGGFIPGAAVDFKSPQCLTGLIF